MEKTLKVTNVLSDPTRYRIYQHLVTSRKETTVAEIAKRFDIHQNVARLHLSKLEDIHLVLSYSRKSGKGGRPARVYTLSNELIELSFPQRDYKTLASIAIESMASLGEAGKQALYQTGKKYGTEMIGHTPKSNTNLSIDDKIRLLEDTSEVLGLYASFAYHEPNQSISFQINNCPFQEIAESNSDVICTMHTSFLKGMFTAMFDNMELKEENNMFTHDCDHCSYKLNLSIV